MNPRHTLATMAAVLLPLAASAHSTATFTTPAKDAVLKESPPEFVLMFNEAAKVAKLTLQKTGDLKPTELGPLPTDAQQYVKLPAPKLGPGEYLLRWRAIGDDGHVVPGVVKFTIAP